MADILKKTPVKQLTVGPFGFATIQEAIAAAERDTEIIVFPGLYEETIMIYQDGLTIRGLGTVIIRGYRKAVDLNEEGNPIGTFATATFFVNAQNILLENLTIENAAGPGEQVGQAVALYLEADQVEVRNCRLLGYQDTLCVGLLPKLNADGTPMTSVYRKRLFSTQRSHFYSCEIEGTVDFIFGGGDAVFENCLIHAKKRDQGVNFLTAAATPENGQGLYFTHCWITGASSYYLGRPWRRFAKTAFVHCQFDEQLAAAGWDDWDDPANRQTAVYREENNRYAAAVTREKWLSFT